MNQRIVSLLSVLTVFLALTTFAAAQSKKAPTERSVSGIVTDESGAAVSGAIVQLKNTKTMQVRSFIAKEKGDYYFHGLSTDVDYELKAQANGKTSASRTLSSFDSHSEATINLQLK
jgi:hypothetical protein